MSNNILKLAFFKFFAEVFLVTSGILIIVAYIILRNVGGYYIQLMMHKPLCKCISLVFFMASFLLINEFGFSFSNQLKWQSMYSTVSMDTLSSCIKLFVCLSSGLFFYLIADFLGDQDKELKDEYVLILYFAMVGLIILCSCRDLISAYLTIELISLASYLLASFRKTSSYSIEAGLKYFVMGSISSAFFILGSSFVYACTGTIFFTELSHLFSPVEIETLSDIHTQKLLEYEYLKEEAFWIDAIHQAFIQHEASELVGKAYLVQLSFMIAETPPSKELMHDLFQLYLKDIEEFKYLSELQKKINTELYLLLQDAATECTKTATDWFELMQRRFDVEKKLSENIEKRRIFLKYCDKDAFFVDFPISQSLKIYFIENTSQLQSRENTLHLVEGAQYIRALLEQQEQDRIFYEIQLENILEEIGRTSNIFVKSSLVLMDNDFFNLLEVGFLLILFSVFVKLALAPFHLWSLDVYEGSPTVSTFFFAAMTKLSFFMFLIHFCYSAMLAFVNQWQFYSLWVAIFSLFVGSFGGLKQRKLKTLLAYSSINHMGYSLLAFSMGSFFGLKIAIIFLIIYMMSSFSIWFSFLSLKLKSRTKKLSKELSDLSLLGKSNPALAFSLAVTFFSIAGLPPFIGFLTKLGVFLSLLKEEFYFFCIIAILCSVISTFYYIRIIKTMFFENALVGKLYYPINSNKTWILSLITFLLLFIFANPKLLFLIINTITEFY